MSAIAELEAQLRTAWDPEAAAVYADALQTAGDARGELIALDLQLAVRGATPALVEARDAALRRWLGDDTTAGHWPPYNVQLGLLDVALMPDAHSTIDDRANAVLGSPGGRYLRQVTIFGDARDVQRALGRLAAQPLPWLEHLVLDQTAGGIAPRRLIAAVAAAAPNLRTLELRGEHMMEPPLPRSVRQLALHRPNALALHTTPVDGVIELDLTFDVLDTVELRSLAPIAGPRMFPDLQRLDLSRNAASYPSAHPRNVDPLVFVAALGELGGLDRLRTLRLPALRRREQRRPLRALLAAYPNLEIEIARSYRVFAEVTAGLRHPRLAIAPSRPWPPGEMLAQRAALAIRLPDRATALRLARCVEVLEEIVDDLSAPARAGWTALWDALEALPSQAAAGQSMTRAFPAAVLATALGEIPPALDGWCADAVIMLRQARLPDGAMVELSRTRIAAGGSARHRGELALERARLALPHRDQLTRHGIGEDLVDLAGDIF